MLQSTVLQRVRHDLVTEQQQQPWLIWISLTTSDSADDTTLMVENEEELKNLLIRVKEDSQKADLKLKHSEN